MPPLKLMLRTEHVRIIWLVISDAWLQVATLSLLAMAYIESLVGRG